MNGIKHQSGVSELNRRVCPRCGKYYPTLKALKAHRSVCENIVFTTTTEEPELAEEECQEDEEIEEVSKPVAEPTYRLNLFDRLNRMYPFIY